MQIEEVEEVEEVDEFMEVIAQGSEQIVSGQAAFFLCGTALTFYNYMLYLPLECLLH